MYLEVIGLFLSIVTVIIVIRRGHMLLWALLAGSAVISLFSLLSPAEIIGIILQTAGNPSTIFLVLMVTGITLLGYTLEKTGTMQRMVSSMYQVITDARYLSALLPAVVSFLAIPGGAIMSAPMVDKAAGDLQLSQVNLSLANLVFRHIFLLISPLYPTIIFMSSMTGESIFRFILFTFPIFLVTVVFSFYYIFRHAAKVKPETSTRDFWPRIGDLVKSFSPFFLVFSLHLAFNLYLPLAILTGVVYTLFLYIPPGQGIRPALAERWRYLYQGINWPMVATTFTIMLYKTIIENADSLSDGIDLLLDRGFPLFLLLILVPYILSLMIGNSVPSLGIALPLLLPVLDGGSSQMAQYGIIYVSAHLGYLGSPVHLCTYLTTEYFKAPLFQVVLQVNLLGIPTLVSAIALSLFF